MMVFILSCFCAQSFQQQIRSLGTAGSRCDATDKAAEDPETFANN
jgi:hypothetical protein